MSEDFTVFTPPVTPPLDSDSKFIDGNNSLDDILDEQKLLKRITFRWFNCTGEANQELHLNENSIINAGEEFLFKIGGYDDELFTLIKRNDCKSTVNLFGYEFDKGSALICNTELLFKFARCELMNLDSIINASNKFGVICQSRDPAKSRRYLVQFLLYIREYLICLTYIGNPTYQEAFKKLKKTLERRLFNFRCLLRRFTDLPAYICQHAAVKYQGGNAVRSGHHHIFHSHLDLRWFHLTTLLMLSKNENNADHDNGDDINQLSNLKNDSHLDFSSIIGNGDLINSVNHFQYSVQYLISELIQLAILRFEKVGVNDVLRVSAFNCTCVRELWLLVLMLIEHREKNNKSENFWNIVNRILNVVLNSNLNKKSDVNTFKLPESYPCSNPVVFILWFIGHLSTLFRFNDREMKSNYNLLETMLKDALKNDVPESTLQLYILLVRKLCLDIWEPKSEPIIILWDYFQKRLNNSFYIPGATLDNLAVLSKSPIGLISQSESRLSGNKQDNSFDQFLQLLGMFLKKTDDSSKQWNQLKGRIYSKFPASKMLSLNETGLYHFVSLFITMAMSRNDITEVCKRLQDFLQFIAESQLDVNKRRLIWQTHLAVLLLLSEKQYDFTQYVLPLLKLVQNLDYSNNLSLMKMFTEGFQDVIDSNSSICHGQSNFIDDWIPKYLNVCPESDAAILLNTICVIIQRLKVKQHALEPAEMELFEKLWFHFKPYIENIGNTLSECPLQLANIAADLAILSIRISHTALRFREMVNIFTSNETIDIRILRRFLCQLIQYKPLKMALPDHDALIIRLWIRCSILSLDVCNTDMSELSSYVMGLSEVDSLVSTINNDSERISMEDEPMILFFHSISFNYNRLQNTNEKTELREKVGRYFNGMKQWLQHIIKKPENPDLINRIYKIVGHIIDHIGPLIYVKSHPMTLLQMLTDLLLLPVMIRKPEFKLNQNIQNAIKLSLNLYVGGLLKLGVEHDKYIERIAQELIVIYLPRCLPIPGERISVINNPRTFSLMLCFNESSCNTHCRITETNIIPMFILNTIKNNFLKQRMRTPPVSCRQALQFLKGLLVVYSCSNKIIKLFLNSCLINVCSIAMYCEDRNHCKKDASDIILQILDSRPIRQDNSLGEELMRMFSKLCKDHLAFSSRQLFNLFNTLSSSGPDLVYRFLPSLLTHIKDVESKRGVGYDRALRAEYDNLEKTLNYLKR